MTAEPKKIAVVSHASLLNGAPVSIAEITLELLKKARQLELHLGLPQPGRLLEAYSLKEARPFFYAGGLLGSKIPLSSPRIARRLKTLFRRKKIDLVLANTLESFRAVEAASDLNIPSIWMIRELIPRYRKRRELEEIKKSAFYASRLIFNSRTSIKYLGLLGEDLERKSRVIYEGIKPPPAGVLEKNFRPELGLSRQEVLVGSVGDICPQKGYGTLLEAFPAVCRSFPRAKLLLIGRSPSRFREFRHRLDDAIDRSGIVEKVLFAGEQTNVFRWLNSLDLLVHPSWGESFGRVIIEALALERPVVAARSGGPEEIIEEGKTGLLVSPRDPGALSRAIDMALGDIRAAKEMGRRGRIMVEKKFNLDRTVAELSEEIDNLLP